LPPPWALKSPSLPGWLRRSRPTSLCDGLVFAFGRSCLVLTVSRYRRTRLVSFVYV
jgi:hypothetical protein